jgi:large subunit ribosomal protein L25
MLDWFLALLYGGNQAVHFSAEEIAFKNLVYTPNAHTVVIELGKNSYNAILTRHSSAPCY